MVALLYTEGIMCEWIVASVKSFGSVPKRIAVWGVGDVEVVESHGKPRLFILSE